MVSVVHSPKRVEMVPKILEEESFTLHLTSNEALAMRNLFGEIICRGFDFVRDVYAALDKAGDPIDHEFLHRYGRNIDLAGTRLEGLKI